MFLTMPTNSERSPYEVLGISPDAPLEQIERAYEGLFLQNADNNEALVELYNTIQAIYVEKYKKYSAAIINRDIDELNVLYQHTPLKLDFSWVTVALNSAGELPDKAATILWLIAHGVDGNETFTHPVTLHGVIRHETRRNGILISSRDEHRSQTYQWETTLLGFAMYYGDIALIHGLGNNPNINLTNILIPASPFREQYDTGLEFAAKNGYIDLVHHYLDKDNCPVPEIRELGNAINNAWGKSQYATQELLIAYRKKHYRYNPFEFRYNQEWSEEVDTSWSATFMALPDNFKIAVNDFIYTCNYLYNAIFNWQALYNAVFIGAGIAATVITFYSLFLASTVIASESLQLLAGSGVLFAYGLSLYAIAAAYEALNEGYLNLMHGIFDPIASFANDFVNGCWLRIKNAKSAIFGNTETDPNATPAQLAITQPDGSATPAQQSTSAAPSSSTIAGRLFFCFTNCGGYNLPPEDTVGRESRPTSTLPTPGLT